MIDPTAEIAKPRSTAIGSARSTSISGLPPRSSAPLDCSSSKTGDSSMVERARSTAPAITAPTAKGIRQPHESSSGPGMKCVVRVASATATSPPTSLAAEASEATKPRRRGSDPSTR